MQENMGTDIVQCFLALLSWKWKEMFYLTRHSSWKYTVWKCKTKNYMSNVAKCVVTRNQLSCVRSLLG